MTQTAVEPQTRDTVREAYAKLAQGARCCDTSINPVMSERVDYGTDQLAGVPIEADMGVGCGNPTAMAGLKPGDTVLDLGSGGGLDCFLAAKAVGPEGRVIGVDMTPEMISKARANAAKADFGNVEFRLGEIEHLPVADGTVDVILSNCVINLSPSKAQVFSDAYRALKPGGRLHVSDVVETDPLPDHMKTDQRLICGCMGGAASVGALFDWLETAGFSDIAIDVSEASRTFIAEWAPGTGVENHIASAAITATKPTENPA
ncbi:MAG: arsenite methyltransferase [Rhodospirillaceae bacterium]|jgi:arsenite methyltransferase|nr:arsenite methyltransferase [Rhodospirillaceae bacterium]